MRASTLTCALCLLGCSASAPERSTEPEDAPNAADRGAAGTSGDPSRAAEPADVPITPGAPVDAGRTAADSAAAVEPVDASANPVAPVDAAARHDGGLERVPDSGSNADAGGPTIVFREPTFFSLPINSVRFGVSGHDPDSDLCISVIWFLGRLDETRFCDTDQESVIPYVWIEAGSPAGCWGYGPNAELLARRGCADFGAFNDPQDDSAQFEVDVHSDLWAGTARFERTP